MAEGTRTSRDNDIPLYRYLVHLSRRCVYVYGAEVLSARQLVLFPRSKALAEVSRVNASSGERTVLLERFRSRNAPRNHRLPAIMYASLRGFRLFFFFFLVAPVLKMLERRCVIKTCSRLKHGYTNEKREYIYVYLKTWY